jgi:hypothetical protein
MKVGTFKSRVLELLPWQWKRLTARRSGALSTTRKDGKVRQVLLPEAVSRSVLSRAA